MTIRARPSKADRPLDAALCSAAGAFLLDLLTEQGVPYSRAKAVLPQLAQAISGKLPTRFAVILPDGELCFTGHLQALARYRAPANAIFTVMELETVRAAFQASRVTEAA